MKIQYVNRLSNLKKDDKPCYQATVKNPGVLDREELVGRLANGTGYTNEMAECFLDVLVDNLRTAYRTGMRINLGSFVGGVVMRGSSPSARTPYAKSGLKLVPYLSVTGNLRRCLDDVSAVNVTESATVIIDNVLDVEHAIPGTIIGVRDVTVHVSGLGLKVDLAAADEGVWIEDKDGVLLEQGRVTASTTTTLDVTFDALPEDGAYYFVVASRGGLGPEYGVSLARRKITVKATAE